jgi:hypothetical protein
MDVDLDHTRVGRDLQQLQARVARRRIALQHQLHAQFLRVASMAASRSR